MTDTFLVDCANCGRQVMTTGRQEDECYWCEKSVNKKEVIMESRNKGEAILQEEPLEKGDTNTDIKAMLAEMSNKEKSRYYREHQAEILEDYANLGTKGMREKWEMSNPGWHGIKHRWMKEGITIPEVSAKARKVARKAKKEVKAETPIEDTQYTEHERYLILIGHHMAVCDILKALRP